MMKLGVIFVTSTFVVLNWMILWFLEWKKERKWTNTMEKGADPLLSSHPHLLSIPDTIYKWGNSLLVHFSFRHKKKIHTPKLSDKICVGWGRDPKPSCASDYYLCIAFVRMPGVGIWVNVLKNFPLISISSPLRQPLIQWFLVFPIPILYSDTIIIQANS